ncbi:Snu56p SCDLUD_001933 [Saccharomycodes ludwigii]|uniref:Snu56p n=1 Tax=Saccharomycodes ludwigii TaxID=36035 RepID=UPI001E8452DE|nr:hypothetical protein SCDLUD_001933 [Saccharomycodes ludwigii]KAH3902120.1 hypothetical protein SCDLUD_001933 [Saccharomycodes ludwigii]
MEIKNNHTFTKHSKSFNNKTKNSNRRHNKKFTIQKPQYPGNVIISPGSRFIDSASNKKDKNVKNYSDKMGESSNNYKMFTSNQTNSKRNYKLINNNKHSYKHIRQLKNNENAGNNRNILSTNIDKSAKIPTDLTQQLLYLRQIKFKLNAPFTTLKKKKQPLKVRSKTKQQQKKEFKKIRNSNVFFLIKSEEEFKLLYNKFNSNKTLNFKNCKIDFIRLHNNDIDCFIIQLFEFNSMDFAMIMIFLFYTLARKTNENLNLHMVVHQSTKLPQIDINSNTGTDAKLIIKKQLINSGMYPGFIGYRIISHGINFFMLKMIKLVSKHWKFDGKTDLIRNKLKKNLYEQMKLNRNNALQFKMGQNSFLKGVNSLKNPNSSNKLLKYFEKLSKYNIGVIAGGSGLSSSKKKDQYITTNISLKSNDITSEKKPTKTSIIKNMIISNNNNNNSNNNNNNNSTSNIDINSNSNNNNTKITTSKYNSSKATNTSTNYNADNINKKPDEDIVSLCLQIIDKSIRQLEFLENSSSPYQIVKVFVKLPRPIYSLPNDKLTSTLLKPIGDKTNCNIVILSYINVHQSLDWFNDLQLPFINDLKEQHCKIINIGGVVGSCKQALNMLKEDIKSKIKK